MNDKKLLRNFDFDAARRGEPVCEVDDDEVASVLAINGHGEVVINWPSVGFAIYPPAAAGKNLRMAPLCWVAGKPVYPGDRLWHDGSKQWITATGPFVGEDKPPPEPCIRAEGEKSLALGYYISALHWAPTLCRREGWVNITAYNRGFTFGEVSERLVRNGSIFDSLESAEAAAERHSDVLASVRIEWEEPE